MPAYYALILRLLTVLEGLALQADPRYKFSNPSKRPNFCGLGCQGAGVLRADPALAGGAGGPGAASGPALHVFKP